MDPHQIAIMLKSIHPYPLSQSFFIYYPNNTQHPNFLLNWPSNFKSGSSIIIFLSLAVHFWLHFTLFKLGCKVLFPMPGIVQVTVLEFKGVSSSSKPSAKSVKVSMGKIHYQTWDKGDFSFPVTKLRENLVVALLDAGGNEIACADIRTMQIMEKGSWDEVFPINGGGHVHMKLQFILSGEERNRIRIVENIFPPKCVIIIVHDKMYYILPCQKVGYLSRTLQKRESAMRKKLELNPNINLRIPETVNSTRDSVETSTKYEQKLSDSQKEVEKIDVMSTKVEASQAGLSLTSAASSALSLSSYQMEGRSILQTAFPNATDESHSAPYSPGKDGVKIESPQVHEMVPDEKIETQPLATIRSDIEGEAPSKLSGSAIWDKNSSVASKLQDDSIQKSQNQGPVKKTPSNVRKMISAFENSQHQDMAGLDVKQEVKSLKKAPSVQSQLNRFRTEGLLEDRESKAVLHPPIISLRKLEDDFTGNLKQNTTTFSGTADNAPSDAESFQAPKELSSTVTPIPSGGNDSNIEDMPTSAPRESTVKELEISPVDLMRQSSSETATSSERMAVEQSQVTQAYKLSSKLLNSSESSVAEGSGSRSCRSEPSKVPKELASTATPIRAGGNDSDNEDMLAAASTESTREELERSPVDLMRQSTSETATTSEGMPEEQSQVTQVYKLSPKLLNSSESSVAEGSGSGSGRGRGTGLKSSTMIKIQVASNPKPKSKEHCKEEYYSAQCSGMWIFPDNTRSLCITTAGKQVTKTVGCQRNETKIHHLKKIPSEPEVLEKKLIHGTESKVGKNQKKVVERSESGCGSSPNGSSNGLLGQVIKISVILGFGVLVFFTRQKEPRKKYREENYNLFPVPDYIDERTVKPWSQQQ